MPGGQQEKQICDGWGEEGHEATETGFAYAPVSQAHGHNHNCSLSCLLHCSVDQFCTTPGGF